MFETDIHLWPLHTSTLDIYKVFELLVCCLKGIWVHPYTVTPAKLAPDLGILGPLWTVTMVPLRHDWGWYPLQTASHILNRHIQSVWAIGMLSQGHMVAPLYRYTGQVGPRFGDFTCGVKMMPQRHGWGWYPPHIASSIHSRNIYSV